MRATDPGSRRLTPDQVIEIHKAHRAGEAWGPLAKQYGTTWKNVSRIVQGLRWRELHPTVRPDLYVTVTDQTPSVPSSILDDLAEIEQRLASIRVALAGII